MDAYRLTIEQKNILSGATYDGVQFFNPVQDINDNWYISVEEVGYCCYSEDYLWVKDLTLETFTPKTPA